MITKTYRSKSDISINVVMPNGKSLHVSFTSVTGGGSTYTTNDENLQKALENHYRYNCMFKLESTLETPRKANQDNENLQLKSDKGADKTSKSLDKKSTAKRTNIIKPPEQSSEVNGFSSKMEQKNEDELGKMPEENTQTNGTIVAVKCPDDAKDYLVEKFGVSRTKLRTSKQIEEQAINNGIVFEGI